MIRDIKARGTDHLIGIHVHHFRFQALGEAEKCLARLSALNFVYIKRRRSQYGFSFYYYFVNNAFEIRRNK